METKAESARWAVIKRMKVLDSIMSTLSEAQRVKSSVTKLKENEVNTASHGVHGGGGSCCRRRRWPGVQISPSVCACFLLMCMHALNIKPPLPCALFLFFLLAFHCAIQCSAWTNKWHWSLLLWPKPPPPGCGERLQQTCSKLCFTAQ